MMGYLKYPNSGVKKGRKLKKKPASPSEGYGFVRTIHPMHKMNA